MRQDFLKFLICPVSAILIMCGGNPTQVVEPTSALKTEAVEKNTPTPPGKMEVPVPDVAWIPATIGADKGKELISALANTRNLALLLPKKLKDAEVFETRVFQMLKAAAPNISIAVKGDVTSEKLLDIGDEFLYRGAGGSSAQNASESPLLISKEDPLSAEWLTKKKSLKGADTILIVRPIEMKAEPLNEMRSVHMGGCDDLEKPLKTALDASSSYFKPYETWAFDILRREFAAQLTSSLALWRSELEQASSTARSGSSEARCIDAYKQYLAKYEVCFNGPCEVAPRIFAAEGGILGMIDETGVVPDSCPTEGMRDFAAEMRKLGERAMVEVLPSLKADWTDELVRAGGLERILSGVKDICAPRHRRIEEGELASAREALKSFLSDLKTSRFPSEWVPLSGKERIVGIGPVNVLARVRPLVSNPSASSSAVIRKLRALDRCVKGADRPIQAALIDVDTSKVLYLGIFFEEALLCEDFAPR